MYFLSLVGPVSLVSPVSLASLVSLEIAHGLGVYSIIALFKIDIGLRVVKCELYLLFFQ